MSLGTKMAKCLMAVAILVAAGCGPVTPPGQEETAANPGQASDQSPGNSTGSIIGGGSSFLYPAVSSWARQYQQQTGVAVNYQSIGSAGGLRQLDEKTLVFAASDMPLHQPELDGKGFLQWPMIVGGIVVVVNVSGVQPGEMVLDGATLADIFLGKITQWDDPRLKKLNPNLDLPGAPITVVHRSDGSGTTFNFTDYLGKVSPAWKSGVGSDTVVNWPVGIGGKGNAGVAQYVHSVPNSIGYVEYAYSMQGGLTYTKLINAAGAVVEPNTESFQAATTAADYLHSPDFYLILTNQPGENTWPIVATTFILMRTQPEQPDKARAALDFFKWCFQNGGPAATKLDYVPIPESVWRLAEGRWSSIQGM